MRRTPVATLIVLGWLVVSGCVPMSRPIEPPPVPHTLVTAAEAFIDDYADGLSKAAAETAAKATAGEFADVTAADEHFVGASKAARDAANQKLVAAMNAALTDEAGKPGAAAAPLYDDLSKGFARRKAVKR